MMDAGPTFARVLEDSIDARLAGMHSCMPARVKKVDMAKQLVDVEPCLSRKYGTGEVVALPVLNNVPICFPRIATGGLFLPVSAGDFVLLVFSERSIDTWKELGGVLDPKDPRKFSLSDAIAIPGVYAKPGAYARAHASFIRLELGTASIEIQPDGKFRIQKVGGEELLNLVSQTDQRIIDLTVVVTALAAAVTALATATQSGLAAAGSVASTAAGSGLFSVGEAIALTAAAASAASAASGATAAGGAAATEGGNSGTVGSNTGIVKGKVDGLTG